MYLTAAKALKALGVPLTESQISSFLVKVQSSGSDILIRDVKFYFSANTVMVEW